MTTNNYSVILSVKEGRRSKDGLQAYKVMHRIDGLTKEKAYMIQTVFSGRLTSTNRVDVVNNSPESVQMLSDIRVGSEFYSQV